MTDSVPGFKQTSSLRKHTVVGAKFLISVQVSTSSQGRFRAQLKLDAILIKNKRKVFHQLWTEFWKKFCDFCERFTCLKLFVVFSIFISLISNQVPTATQPKQAGNQKVFFLKKHVRCLIGHLWCTIISL